MVREARPDDAAAIAVVHVTTWRAAYVGLIPQATLDALDVDARRASWGRILGAEAPPSRTAVCERGGEIVGFCSVGPSRDEGATDADGEIWALYVTPRAWSTGAGRELLAHGIALLAARGRRDVLLWVLDGNARAIRFYERAGFSLDGTTRTIDELPHQRMTRALH
ncbi:MAG TPA: GNAT family N-acetyltransferase [Byssovorax sp.]